MSFKTLYILRHAKAAPVGADVDDHERPLSERGERDALAIGEAMRRHGLLPKRVLCSTSLRTRQTLHQLERALDQPLAVEYSSKLYLAAPRDILWTIAQVDAGVPSLLIIGHNPTLHQLCVDLTAEGEKKLMNELIRGFPTAALAEIHYPAAEWSELGPKRGTLARFLMPGALSLAEAG